MLHTDQRHLKLHSQCGGISAGMEIRVQVVGDGMRFYTEPIKQGLRGTFVRLAGIRIVKIPYAVADVGLMPCSDAKRILEPGADGQ
jgi:hypothetical protein